MVKTNKTKKTLKNKKIKKVEFHLDNVDSKALKLKDEEILFGRKIVDNLFKFGFIFVKVLGTGGYCIVCLFEKNGRRYAIKSYLKIKASIFSRINLISDHFNKYLKKCKKNNKFILNYKILELDDVHYVISEPLDGDLFNHLFYSHKTLSGKHIPLDLMSQYNYILFCQLIYSMKCLHNIKVVHGDLKPENIFIKNNDLQIKIGDFDGSGINNPKNRIDVHIYTSLYMHPSVDINKISDHNFDYSDDVYSIGLISVMIFDRELGHYIVGIRPQFSELQLEYLISKIKSSYLIPKELKGLIIKMLNKQITIKQVYAYITKNNSCLKANPYLNSLQPFKFNNLKKLDSKSLKPPKSPKLSKFNPYSGLLPMIKKFTWS